MQERDAYAVGEGRPVPPPTPTPSEPSIAQLLGNLLGNAQHLVRREIDLAKAEVSEKLDQARQGAIMLGAGLGTTAIGGVFLLVALAEALVAYAILDRWLAYLIIGAIFSGIGAIVLNVGMQQFRQVNPVPHETIDSIRKDISWLSEQNPSDRT